MVVYEYPGEFVPAWLAQLLRAASVACLGVTCSEDEAGAVKAVQVVCPDDTSEASVAAVVAGYTPPPPPPPPGPTMQEKVAAALQRIQTGDGAGPVTADQLASVIQALTS